MIRWLVAGSALMIGSACHAATGEREFAAGMRERFLAAAPELETRISSEDPLVLDVKYEGEWGKARINLHRLHTFCAQADAEDCEAVLANFVERTAAPLPDRAAPDLRVVVRNRLYLEHLLETQPAESQPIYRQIGDDLYALLAFAYPNGVGMAVPEQLRTLGLEEAGAWTLAATQTRAILPELPFDVDLARYPVSFQEYDFLPSLLADLDAWPPLAAKAGPDLFAAPISDFSVWIGVMSDGPRFEAFKEAVRAECAEWERCISPNVYRFRDGRWVVAE